MTVPEDQLSLAIGKKGQNVRLAAKLVGWHIDIRSAEEAARAAAAQLEAVMAGGEATLTDIRDSLALDQITAERLKGRGIETIDQLALISVDELVDAIDVSYDQANEILERAHRLLAQKHAREAREAREAEEAAAKAATENESGEPVTATAEGEESGAAEPVVEKLAEGFDAEEIGAEETTQPEALAEDERLAEDASEPAIEAAPEEPVIAFEAAAEHETAAEVLPESENGGAETESGIEERVEPEHAAADDEPHKDE